MKKLVLLLICLLMMQLSFSQTTYPTKIIIEKDTVIAILPSQLNKINSVLVENEFLQKEVVLKDSLVQNQLEIIEVKDRIIDNYKAIDFNYQSEIKNYKLIVENQNNLMKQQNKINNRKTLVIGSVCFGIGLIVGIFSK